MKTSGIILLLGVLGYGNKKVMKKVFFKMIVFSIALFSLPVTAFSAEQLIYSFEGDLQGWAIPDWSREHADYVSKDAVASDDFASHANSSMKLTANFLGEGWYAAVVDVEGPFDWSRYSSLLCDVYLPEGSPDNIRARIAITVGEEWLWIEMAGAATLVPGKWVTVSANLIPGNEDWKTTKMVERIGDDGKVHGYVAKVVRVPMTVEYKNDIRLLTLRIEANRIKYDGAFYIDNIRLVE